jgi:hypothetical protein
MSAPKASAAKPAGKPGRRGKGAAPAPRSSGFAKPAVAKTAAVKPAKSAPPNDDASHAAKKLAADIDRALAEGRTDLLSTDALQALMAAVCRSYSAQVEAGSSFGPLADRSRVTSTDVMVTASGLLKSANLAVFELGMWQSWTGR